MKKNFFILFLFVVVGVVGYKLGEKSVINQSLMPAGEKITADQAPASSDKSEFDTDQDYYYSFFKKKGLTMTSFNYEDLTGDGRRQAVFNTIGTGCGSCHYNEIHVFQGMKEIFVFYGEDSWLTPIDGKGFKITQPVLKAGQSYSERNELQWATYKWDGKIFVQAETSPNWVDEPQSPG